MRAALRIIFVTCTLLTGCASSAEQSRQETGGVINFVDAKEGLRIVYPGDWKEQTYLKPRGAIVILEMPRRSDSKLPGTLSVVAQDPSIPVSSADLPAMETRLIDKAQNTVGNFQLVETSDTTLGSEPARRIIYTGTKLGMSLRVMNVITAHNGRGYAIAFMSAPEAFDETRPEVDKVVKSFEFLR